MTPKEILDGCEHSIVNATRQRILPCRQCADDAVAAAFAQEREACAQVADAVDAKPSLGRLDKPVMGLGSPVARAIRARTA